MKDGDGPRHLIFDHQGKFAYQVNEMGSTISVFAWNAAEGMLSLVQEAKINSGGSDIRSGSAELQFSNDGKFLYESNRLSRDYDRLPGTIGIYAVDPTKGTLTEMEYSPSGGTMPRSFGIDLAAVTCSPCISFPTMWCNSKWIRPPEGFRRPAKK